MQTNAKVPTANWIAIRQGFEDGELSIRALARAHGVTDTAIHKRAKAGEWERAGRPDQQRAGSPRRAICISGSRKLKPIDELSGSALLAEAADIGQRELVSRGRDLAVRLLGELDATTTHLGEIEEAIVAYTADDKDGRRRYAMLKAVELPTRATVLKNLALAAKTLAEVTPGKKAEAADAAKQAGAGRFATPSGPRLAVSNG